MQTEPTPTIEDIYRVWRADRSLSPGAALVYMRRIRSFRSYCAERGLIEREELTLERANRFIGWYARRQNLDPRSLGLFRSALQSLNRVYRSMGLAPPDWRSPRPAKPPATPLLAEYADYLLRHRGNPQVTVHKKLQHIGKFQGHLKHLALLLDVGIEIVDFAYV
ncbi:MAG: hypothetical protein E5Y82_33570, partial [Mesorhizobium sp.]